MSYGNLIQAGVQLFGAIQNHRATKQNIAAARKHNTRVLAEMNDQVQNVLANIEAQRMNTQIAMMQIKGKQSQQQAASDVELNAAGLVGASREAFRTTMQMHTNEALAREEWNFQQTAENLREQAVGITRQAAKSGATIQAGSVQAPDLSNLSSMVDKMDFGSLGSSIAGWFGGAGGGMNLSNMSSYQINGLSNRAGGFGQLQGQAGMYSSWLGRSTKVGSTFNLSSQLGFL